MIKDNMNETTSQALVAPSDIAEMAGVSRGAVSNWRKRTDDFPEAIGGTAAKPLFARDAVLTWLTSRGYSAKKDSGEVHVWSALNALRGEIPVDAMSDLILSLACARMLSDESESTPSPWTQIRERVVVEGLSVLDDVVHEEFRDDPRWLLLIDLSSGFRGVAPAQAAEVVEALSDVTDLASIADYVLAKLGRAQIRGGLEHGFVESRISKSLGILAATNGGSVLYDPACGIGAALLSALDSGMRPELIVGHEIDGNALKKASQRAYLRGVDIKLRSGDVLTEDLDEQLQADVVIVEPPYGARLPESVDVLDRRWVFGMPTPRSSELTWIQHTIAHLAENGRGFVVTPVSALSRGSEKAVRTELVRRGCVEAIIGLPGKMLPHVAVNLAIWVLRAPTDESRSDILFVDASEVDDVEKRIGSWLSALNGNMIDVPHQSVDIRDILTTDTDLAPYRWIQIAGRNPAEVADTYVSGWRNLNQTLDRISGASGSLRHFAGTSGTRIVTVGDLIDQGLLEVRPGRAKTSDLPGELKHLYVTPAQIKNGKISEVDDADTVPTNLQAELTEDGDVLVSTHGSVCAVVDDMGGGHLLGYGTYRLRSTNFDQLAPYYLALVLSGSWNNRFQTGSGIGRADIRLLEVPLVPKEEQVHVRLADMSVGLLLDQAHSLLTNAESVREAMLDALRYNVTLPEVGK